MSFPAEEYRLTDLCHALLSNQGEASGIAIASAALERYAGLNETDRLAFFGDLARDFDPDPNRVMAAAQGFADENSSASLAELIDAVEPPRQQLFRRLNQAPGGTEALVGLRSDLLGVVRERPTLQRVDTDLQHLFASWFNRGFLVLDPIDWSTPADILEKIIDYEAVHEIATWSELRRRVEPPDRRCYAFFHPAMPSEPLVFVEVALTRGTPDTITELLAEDRTPLDPMTADTAVFYSISNCQDGLRGISFGHFLIKQVVAELSREVPNISRFVTLSPAPTFARWVRDQADAGEASERRDALTLLEVVSVDGWRGDRSAVARYDGLIRSLGARYYLEAKNAKGKPLDPVARFHLGNGAFLAAIKPLANPSPAGMAQSLGMMVSYRYRFDRIEENHEAYAADDEVRAHRDIRSHLHTPAPETADASPPTDKEPPP